MLVMTFVEPCASFEEAVRAMPSGAVPMHEGQQRLQPTHGVCHGLLIFNGDDQPNSRERLNRRFRAWCRTGKSEIHIGP